MATARDACTVVTYAPGLIKPRYLGSIGHVTSLNYGFTMPGGCDQLSCLLQASPQYRTDALDPGRIVHVQRGASVVWDGNLMEAVPTTDGWNVTAVGLGSQGTDFQGYYSTWNLNDPINQAITRGLRWKNPGISSGWLLQKPDVASFTLTDHMNNITSKQGQTWYVQRDGTVKTMSLPSGANRLLVSGDPVPRTLFADITTIFIKYTVSDDGQGNTSYATTSYFNQAAIDKHNAHETYLDLSDAGVMSASAAQATGANYLAKYSRAAWAGPFTARRGQLLTMGGSPIDPATDQAGTVCRLLVSDAPYGGEVNAGAIEFIVGQYVWDDESQLASITPFQSYRDDLSSILSNFDPHQ